mmetsp:Transcript_132673/g.248139  ORF Transcript_132673/g.248139 Transcript_132673/m.248139 type:complete len:211 (-) Transcript_132673:2700-3332(-)
MRTILVPKLLAQSSRPFQSMGHTRETLQPKTRLVRRLTVVLLELSKMRTRILSHLQLMPLPHLSHPQQPDLLPTHLALLREVDLLPMSLLALQQQVSHIPMTPRLIKRRIRPCLLPSSLREKQLLHTSLQPMSLLLLPHPPRRGLHTSLPATSLLLRLQLTSQPLPIRLLSLQAQPRDRLTRIRLRLLPIHRMENSKMRRNLKRIPKTSR